MDITITPGALRGNLQVIPSKSQAHRLLICAAFAQGATELVCPQTNRDIEATTMCLRALGAKIERTATGYTVTPASQIPQTAVLPCGESGSTLRFLLPVVGALGVEGHFKLEGRLPMRPLSPLWEEMERMGCTLDRPSPDTIRCRGKLQSGLYSVDGGVSSQFITGLLLAFPLISGGGQLQITGSVESKPYITMTQQAMALFGVGSDDYRVTQRLCSPGKIAVEGDWSNGAFFLAAKALGSDVTVQGLATDSAQGDRAADTLIPMLRTEQEICAGDIPDLVPILSVVAAANQGGLFTKIGRLRLKESDRVATVMAMLRALGIESEATCDTLRIYPGTLTGGTVDAANDHRIAMAAAIAATVATGPVTILGAQCVSKSYPQFFEEYARLGGNYEQHIR